MPLNDQYSYVRGTTPVNENRFTISGAMPHPAIQLALTLEAALKKKSVEKIAEDYPMLKKYYYATSILHIYIPVIR